MFDHQGAEKLHINTQDDTNLNKLNKEIKRIKKKIFCFYCFLFLDVCMEINLSKYTYLHSIIGNK